MPPESNATVKGAQNNCRNGLKSQQQRQAKRKCVNDAYRILIARVSSGEHGGPDKVFNAARRAGETKGLGLSTLKRKCKNPESLDNEWQSLMVLPGDCENELVEFLIHQNRNGDPLTKADVDPVILRALEAIAEVQAAGGRDYQPLTKAALKVLKNKGVGQSYFNRFHAKYEKLLTRKHAQEVDIRRALWCTEEVSIAHFTKCTRFFHRLKICDANGKWLPGKKLCVFFGDECPHVIDGGPLKGTGTKAYGAVGEAAYRVKKKCRELVTYDACFNLETGTQVAPHLIYACKKLTSELFPDPAVVNNCLVSNTESGFQNSRTWLQQLKHVRATTIVLGCTEHAAMVTDNGPGREDEEVMEWLGNLELQQEDQMDYILKILPDDMTIGDCDLNTRSVWQARPTGRG